MQDSWLQRGAADEAVEVGMSVTSCAALYKCRRRRVTVSSGSRVIEQRRTEQTRRSGPDSVLLEPSGDRYRNRRALKVSIAPTDGTYSL